MVEDCYILYSCDGSYEPIVSNFSGLSAHSSSYVRVYLTDPVDGNNSLVISQFRGP